MERFISPKKEIKTFLQPVSSSPNAKIFLENLNDDHFLLDVAFLADIFQHMNLLNIQLQGRDQCVIDLIERVSAFQKNLELFSHDLASERLIHLKNLRAHIEVCKDKNLSVTTIMKDFLCKVQNNFSNRLSDFCIDKNMIKFVRNPFQWEPPQSLRHFIESTGLAIDEGNFGMEVIDLKESSALLDHFNNVGSEQFWVDLDEKTFPNSKKVSFFFLTMFGSTYVCESSFSHMNAIKSGSRTSFLDSTLDHCLRIAMTTFEPDF